MRKMVSCETGKTCADLQAASKGRPHCKTSDHWTSSSVSPIVRFKKNKIKIQCFEYLHVLNAKYNLKNGQKKKVTL